MADFLLIRHAAHGHLGHTLSGRLPGIALSDAGAAQARRLADRLAGERLDAILASPVQRAVETAKAIGAATGVAVDVEPALDEIDFGEWTGRRFDQFGGDIAWARWNEERSIAQVPGGESMVQAQARIVGLIRQLSVARPDATIALVTHCDMIRAGVCWAVSLSLDRLLRFEVDAASVTRLTVENMAARLVTLNERTD